MHEFGIVNEIINSVEREVKKRKCSKVLEIHLELGQLMGIQPETLKFLLKEMSQGTSLENAKIKINFVLPEVECELKHKSKLKNLKLPEHFHDFPISDLKCPICGKPVNLLKGNECVIKKIICK